MVMANTLMLVLGVLPMLGVFRLKYLPSHMISWDGISLLFGEMSNFLAVRCVVMRAVMEAARSGEFASTRMSS
jgi:hypothetical protein